MNVKRYIAPNVQEAMIKIKNELGRDAIILHTRKIKQKGLKGLFKKPLVEVVAAIQDEHEIKKAVEVKPVQPRHIVEEVAPQPVVIREVEKTVENIIEKNVEDTSQIASLKSEIDEIKDMLKTYIAKPTQMVQEDVSIEEFNDVERETREFLKSLEIKDSIIEKIMTIVKRQVSLTPQNEPMVRSAVRQAIKDYIGEPFTIDGFPGEQRVFLFAGPTGVGKTTTLAKLAAKLSLLDNKKVGLITADTYRIAAVDQLKTYSEILGIPLSVVYEASELGDVMYKYKDKDIVLLDTAGRSHKSDELSRDLQDLMNNLENPEIFLVISLTTGYKDIVSILDAYSFIDKYRLIFTKLDEASTYSNILNVKVESGHELSYITNGQSVPDDIEIAESEKIANYIVGEAK
ncbi:MAG: flagellar biosynthesis protein FlhF [Clostridiales bacterium]|nr:flagellar biosynthesis protein FlhF [Clostridiales bacterium]